MELKRSLKGQATTGRLSVGLTPSSRLVDMLLSDQVLIGQTIAGVTFIKREALLNPLFLGMGGTYADLIYFISD